MGNFVSGLGVVGFVVLIIALLIFWPFVVIWSVNTLFPAMAIPYTFWTWLATLIFTMTFGKANISANKSN
jgi:hypothetical protein